jgi:hypothetical protein
MDTNIKIAQSKVNSYLCAQWNRRLNAEEVFVQVQALSLSMAKRLATSLCECPKARRTKLRR